MPADRHNPPPITVNVHPLGSAPKAGSTLHWSTCRYAGKAKRSYGIYGDEAARRLRTGDPHTRFCRTCGLERVIATFVNGKELWVTIGAPGSGKTHWAEKFRAAHEPGTVVCVSRDSTRLTLHGGFVPIHFPRHQARDIRHRLEEQVTAAQLATIRAAWACGARVVIADDTNLRPGDLDLWRDFALRERVDLHIQDFRDVPWETCLARNADRPRTAKTPSVKVPGRAMKQMRALLNLNQETKGTS